MIRVALADDQELMRSALTMMVESQPDLSLVGVAADGLEAVELARYRAIDVMMMDLRMPRLDGIAATSTIVTEHPGIRVLALTTFDLDEYAFPVLRAGASGFLLKDARGEEIVAAIRTVHAGHGVVSPSTTRRLIQQVAGGDLAAADRGRRRAALDAAGLTVREHEMLLELATGDNNAEIAARLHLSEATVKTHVGHVLAKLGLRDRVQAVVVAFEAGIVGSRPPG